MICRVVWQLSTHLYQFVTYFLHGVTLSKSDCATVSLRKAVPRTEATLDETRVNSNLLDDVDIEEQFLIQDTLLDDIRVQAAQLLQLEQSLVSGWSNTAWIPWIPY